METKNPSVEVVKKTSWFQRHRILSAIFGFFILISLVNTISSGGKGVESIPQQPVSNASSSSSKPESNSVAQPISSAATPAVVTETSIKINAKDLYKAYENNEIAAGQKYQGKIVEVQGTISTIGKDIMGSPYVGLKTSNVIGLIQCLTADSENSRVAELNKGQSVTVVGKVIGFTFGMLEIDNCVIN
jgi:hypothetical protein